jgi:hypothetical protein
MRKVFVLLALVLVVTTLCTSGGTSSVSFSDKSQLEEDLNDLTGSMDEFEEMAEDFEDFSFSGYESGGLFS